MMLLTFLKSLEIKVERETWLMFIFSQEHSSEIVLSYNTFMLTLCLDPTDKNNHSSLTQALPLRQFHVKTIAKEQVAENISIIGLTLTRVQPVTHTSVTRNLVVNAPRTKNVDSIKDTWRDHLMRALWCKIRCILGTAIMSAMTHFNSFLAV